MTKYARRPARVDCDPEMYSVLADYGDGSAAEGLRRVIRDFGDQIRRRAKQAVDDLERHRIDNDEDLVL
jgi:hypothetical protein